MINHFHDETPQEVRDTLTKCQLRNERIRVFYGNTQTGQVWPEENDVSGYVRNSIGPQKIPLLVHPNATGSCGMLDHCIVGIVAKRGSGCYFIYRHPKFDNGTWEVVGSDAPIKDRNGVPTHVPFDVLHNGKVHASFLTERAARRYVQFMTGKRIAK